MRKVNAFFSALLSIVALTAASKAAAQTNSYTQTNLSSDTAGMARFVSPDLINPWGVAFIPGNPFWIADNNSGKTTLYDKTGNLLGTFTVPPPAGSSNRSTPTGIVANTLGGFKVDGISSVFIFDTEDGTISGWYPTIPTAILAVDNSTHSAVYKGLALVSNGNSIFLLAANFNSGKVEVFDSNFSPTTLQGTFSDSTIPAGFAPFGIQVVGPNEVVVTYAQQDAAKRDPVHAAGAGYVNLFDGQGNLVRRIASQGTLNAPWGVALAPATFGQFQGALLIGNFGDGTISAFNLNSGMFLGQLEDSNGNVIANPSLWALVFDPTGQTGDPNTLNITAGLANEGHGLFAAITANATQPPATADFTVAAFPTSRTITAGQSASFTISVSALNGFGSAVSFSCSGEPAGTSCNFSPSTVTPQGGTAGTTTLTIATSSSPYHPMAMLKGTMGMWLPISTFGMFGFVAVEYRRRRRVSRVLWWRWISYAYGLCVILTTLFAVAGCGGYNNNGMNGTPRGAATIVVTANPAQPGGVSMHTQAIANTAGFHFAFIEQGGSSLYPSLAQRVTSLEVLRILLSIGPTETSHSQTWHDKAGNIIPLTDTDAGFPGSTVTFPNLNASSDPNVADEFQTNLIMPEPTFFLNRKFGPVSIIRSTRTKGVAMAALQSLIDDGLFVGHTSKTGKSDGFVELLRDLAEDADEAQRGGV